MAVSGEVASVFRPSLIDRIRARVRARNEHTHTHSDFQGSSEDPVRPHRHRGYHPKPPRAFPKSVGGDPSAPYPSSLRKLPVHRLQDGLDSADVTAEVPIRGQN